MMRVRNCKTFAALGLAALAFALCLALTLGAGVAHADTVMLTIDAKYGQTEARSQLALINEFRKGNDAWAWDETNTTKVKYPGLTELKYDYGLEKIAMQRAAEIAVLWDHTRPNGELCFSLYTFNYGSAGENIAAGYGTAKSAFIGWREDNDDYKGQGHRRNMLSSSFGYVGIGHAVVDGYHFWVQEFSGNPSGITQTIPNDASTLTDVETDENLIDSVTITRSAEDIFLTCGQSIALPSVKVEVSVQGNYVPVANPCVYMIGDPGVATISGSRLKAGVPGKTNLAIHAFNADDGVPVAVQHAWKTTITPAGIDKKGMAKNQCTGCGQVSMSEIAAIDSVALNKTTLTYTGSALKPTVTVKDSAGKTIASGNYTVTYANNVNAGTATAKVTFKGKYEGTVTKTFKITPKSVTPAVTLSASSATYSGKGCAPAVTVKANGRKLAASGYSVQFLNSKGAKVAAPKAAGVYKVKVTLGGNLKGGKTLTYKVLPKKVTDVSLKAQKKAITVKWSKATSAWATGYQVRYSTSAGMSGATTVKVAGLSATKKVVKGLKKGKRYYVQVRAYKTAGGTVYGAWSARKSIVVR